MTALKKIALLSNVNIDMVSKLLPNQEEVFRPQGYGNAFSLLLDTNSDLAKFAPYVIFFIVDITALTAAAMTYEEAVVGVDEWFMNFRACIDPKVIYYVSDVSIRRRFIEDTDELLGDKLEAYWLEQLRKLMQDKLNLHRFPLKKLIIGVGMETFYSEQLWYMGKVPYTLQGCKLIAEEVKQLVMQLDHTPKKVLVLDLDNTLWGGVVGELGLGGIQLSDDKVGALYRDAQRSIKQMQKHGVILAINSKNNTADAMEIISNHPHMALREEDFAVMKINWDTKAENMQAIAGELNLGLDSFVFVDDMPVEREAIRSLLPMIEVPEFPNSVEELPNFFEKIYNNYFRKHRMTKEDALKTRQYQENLQRSQLELSLDYNTFLESLKLKVERVDYDNGAKLRLVQLLQKTNQFNLTTKRYTEEEITELEQKNWLIFVFRAADKFGDHGTIAAILVDTTAHIPRLDTFVMSCRVMGKKIENYLLDYVEQDLIHRGYDTLYSEYIPTTKNAPVKELYSGLGYQLVNTNQETKKETYQLDLNHRPKRSYYIETN